MKNITIKADISSLTYEELSEQAKTLIDAAKDATSNSYSPYSNFSVGAALRLEDGTIIKGANQENAAFQSPCVLNVRQYSTPNQIIRNKR